MDWSSHQYDLLYTVAGNEMGTAIIPFPTDNFNSITVGMSSKLAATGSFRQVSTINEYDEDADGARTSTDLIAPGNVDDTLSPSLGGIDLTDLNNATRKNTGTSFAAPHVAGTIALLLQYGDERHSANAAGFTNLDYSHHQVVKAILMNSADKINDNSIVMAHGLLSVPAGGFLGQSRTVYMQNGTSTWFDSAAANKDPATGGTVPIDNQMGTGELNAARALLQFQGGQFRRDAAVPDIGWDFGLTNGTSTRNVYAFNQALMAGSFASITLCWDRIVTFDTDGGTSNQYDIGDTFNPTNDVTAPGHDQFSDLDLWLLPFGSTSTGQAIAVSETGSGTVEHIFFQIPTTARYEFWITQHNNNGGPQVNYGVAWWGLGTGPIVALGDLDQSGRIDIGDVQTMLSALSDLDKYKSTHGGLSDQDLLDIGDIDGDLAVTNLDLQALIVSIANDSGSGSISPVPEPSSIALMGLAGVGLAIAARRNRQLA